MKKKLVSVKNIAAVVLAVVCCLLAATLSFAATARFDPQKVHGPKIEKLCMVIVNNTDAQILAAENGDLDVVSDIVRPSDIQIISRNKHFDTSIARAFHAFFMLINTQEGIWKDKYVRQAAAQAIDRNNIVRTIFSGYCEPINSWLPPVSPWALQGRSANLFNRAAARAKLKKRGFKWGLDGMLIAPDGKPVKKMKLLTPLAKVAPTTAELAEQVADSLRAAGFPVEAEPMDFSAMISKIDRKEYSLAVMAWSMGRNPDSLHGFYHSSMNIPGGYNYSGISDKALDKALDGIVTAKTKAEARKASDKAQILLEDLVPSVPIYSRLSVAAVSNSWKNIITTERMTADNMWTIMLAEPRNANMKYEIKNMMGSAGKASGNKKIMRMLLAEEPRNLNPFTASSAYSWQVLGMMYEGLLETDPFTLDDAPGIAEKWSVNAGKNQTVIRFTLKPNLLWSDGSRLTSHDFAQTVQFIKKNKIPRFLDAVKNVKSVSCPTERDIVVTLSGESYWYLDKIGGMLCMPAKTLKAVRDWQNWNPLDKSQKFGPYGFICTGPFIFESYRPGEYVMMRRNENYRRLKR